MSVTHAFVSAIPSSTDATLVRPSEWNADHVGNGLDWFNVQDAPYSATGDGATNDTTAVSAAITAAAVNGGVVYFPSGTYRVNVNRSALANVRLTGAGPSSILQPYTLSAPALLLDGAAGTIVGIELDHLQIDGRNRDGQTGGPTKFGGVLGMSIHDCRFYDCTFRAINFSNDVPSSDVYPPGKVQVWIERNTFLQSSLDAIFMGNIGSFWIRDNYIEGALDTAIDGGQGGEYGVISGNVVQDCQTGIYMSDFTQAMIVTDNIVTGATGNCIHVDSGTYGAVDYVIANNIVSGTGGGTTGIHSGGIIGATNGVAGSITDNIISACDYAGMMMNANADGTLIAGNIFRDPPGAAMRLYSAGLNLRDNVLGGGAVILSGAAVGTVMDPLGDGAFSAGLPLSLSMGDSSSAGDSAYAAHLNHVHGLPAYEATATAIGTASAGGGHIAVSRGDHAHGFTKAAYVNPATATAGQVATALINAGIMAAS